MLPPHAWQGVQIHGDLTPHSQQHQRSTHTSVAPSTFTVSAEQPVNSEQSSVQQHVTRLLTEEALAAVADDVTVDIQVREMSNLLLIVMHRRVEQAYLSLAL